MERGAKQAKREKGWNKDRCCIQCFPHSHLSVSSLVVDSPSGPANPPIILATTEGRDRNDVKFTEESSSSLAHRWVDGEGKNGG